MEVHFPTTFLGNQYRIAMKLSGRTELEGRLSKSKYFLHMEKWAIRIISSNFRAGATHSTLQSAMALWATLMCIILAIYLNFQTAKRKSSVQMKIHCGEKI